MMLQRQEPHEIEDEDGEDRARYCFLFPLTILIDNNEEGLSSEGSLL
jgi:hypothetical protein